MTASGEGAPVLTADLGGTQLRAAVIDGQGTLLARVARPSPPDDPAALPAVMAEALAQSGVEVAGAVVGVPGPVSYAEGRPLRLPNLPGWEGHVSAQGIADAIHLPTVIANDADLGALGEHRFGAGRGTSDMAYITISTGVGAGVVLNSELVHGRRSLAEVGWITIDVEREQTVEDLGSGTTLTRLSGLPGAEVTRRAAAGDADAQATFDRVVRAFSVGVLNLVFCFMPERVVIGGGVSQAGDLLLRPVREYIARRGPSLGIVPEIVLAEGGDDVGLRGGLALWRDLEAASASGRASSLTPARPAAG